MQFHIHQYHILLRHTDPGTVSGFMRGLFQQFSVHFLRIFTQNFTALLAHRTSVWPTRADGAHAPGEPPFQRPKPPFSCARTPVVLRALHSLATARPKWLGTKAGSVLTRALAGFELDDTALEVPCEGERLDDVVAASDDGRQRDA
eukprot:4889457-Prymnesium_polylepis.1